MSSQSLHYSQKNQKMNKHRNKYLITNWNKCYEWKSKMLEEWVDWVGGEQQRPLHLYHVARANGLFFSYRISLESNFVHWKLTFIHNLQIMHDICHWGPVFLHWVDKSLDGDGWGAGGKRRIFYVRHIIHYFRKAQFAKIASHSCWLSVFQWWMPLIDTHFQYIFILREDRSSTEPYKTPQIFVECETTYS